MIEVALIGDGQLARGVAAALESRGDILLAGPSGRGDTAAPGADLTIIATTTRLADVAGAIESAVRGGSNVIVSAEESAFPWAVDSAIADRLDRLAVREGVTILGAGLNPGFVFDALVLTLLGVTTSPRRISVERTVDLSGFGPAVRSRLGLGFSPDEFAHGVARGEILGHAGFPQSMSIVARSLALELDRIDTALEPVLENGRSVGVVQEYVGIVDGAAWYRARFEGHLSPGAAGLTVRDAISIESDGPPLNCVIDPGIGSQAGSRAIIANSIDRVMDAQPGWLTVADLPPAHPRFTSLAASTR